MVINGRRAFLKPNVRLNAQASVQMDKEKRTSRTILALCKEKPIYPQLRPQVSTV